MLRVGGTQVSFKMIYWRHWRLVWAQMRSFRDPERLLDDLLQVMRGSCSAGARPGWLAGRTKAEGTRPVEGKPLHPGPYINLSNRLLEDIKRLDMLEDIKRLDKDS